MLAAWTLDAGAMGAFAEGLWWLLATGLLVLLSGVVLGCVFFFRMLAAMGDDGELE